MNCEAPECDIEEAHVHYANIIVMHPEDDEE